MISAVSVSKRFGPTTALHEASLQIKAGEVVAVVGPSGSGKSTLLHCLACIVPPDEGEVCFDGRRIDRLREPDRTLLRREHFGFVFQFSQLVPDLTAVENVMLPLMLAGTRRDAARHEAEQMLKRLDLDGLQGRRPGELSGGQAQRVAVARALVHRPDIVFADEPTGSLDSHSGEHVLALLVEAARERQAAVVIVTHDVHVASTAQRQILVRDGHVTGGEAA